MSLGGAPGVSGRPASNLYPYLEVVCGELQHVPQGIADDLGLPLQDHALVIQGLHNLRLHLQRKEHWTSD